MFAIAPTSPQAMKPGMTGMKMSPMWRNIRWTALVWCDFTLARVSAARSADPVPSSGSRFASTTAPPTWPETRS